MPGFETACGPVPAGVAGRESSPAVVPGCGQPDPAAVVGEPRERTAVGTAGAPVVTVAGGDVVVPVGGGESGPAGGSAAGPAGDDVAGPAAAAAGGGRARAE